LVTSKLTKLTDQQQRIIQHCEVPRSQADLMSAVGMSHRTFFRRKHLDPLIRAGLVQMTHPEDPNLPKQAFIVTKAGLGLVT
jgi:ATP-dependent DNA helicase RecG